MKACSPRPPRPSGGFSLIEVAIALGIAAFVMAGLAGAWSSGQDRLRGAIDMTIAAQLAQRISAEMEVADFSDVLVLAGMSGQAAPAMGWLPRRYFSYVGREVMQDEPERIYEVLTRVVHRGQLPATTNGGAARWDAQGQLVLSIEIVFALPGMHVPVGANGLVDRKQFRRPVAAFPFVVGGSSIW